MDISKEKKALKASSPYGNSSVITREQFLFYEVRTTAGLRLKGMNDQEIIHKVVKENLFQYPTERSVRSMVSACLKRLDCLGDETLVEAIVKQPSNEAKQICLYAMMKQYRVMWDFMITVIGEKYRQLNMSFSKMDLNGFFVRLQEQDDWVSTWSESTVSKLKQIIVKVLVENEYLDSNKSETLLPVLICPVLENSIRASGETLALTAFNCFL